VRIPRRVTAHPSLQHVHASILNVMSQTLRAEDVRKIAALARLELTGDEVDLFSRQLTDILAYVDALQKTNTTGVPPTSHPLGDAAMWREDTPRPSLDRNAVLTHAPGAAASAGLFRVPKVL
jgi:aspartyl-tRNA(Asn)/glutamyl-tRNA(Gln) amidotransferase subunit C